MGTWLSLTTLPPTVVGSISNYYNIISAMVSASIVTTLLIILLHCHWHKRTRLMTIVVCNNISIQDHNTIIIIFVG
jgi:hypothetical protein